MNHKIPRSAEGESMNEALINFIHNCYGELLSSDTEFSPAIFEEFLRMTTKYPQLLENPQIQAVLSESAGVARDWLSDLEVDIDNPVPLDIDVEIHKLLKRFPAEEYPNLANNLGMLFANMVSYDAEYQLLEYEAETGEAYPFKVIDFLDLDKHGAK